MTTYYLLLFVILLYLSFCFFFFFKQKTAYEMRISDWSSDVCSSDLKEIDGAAGKSCAWRGDAARSGGAVSVAAELHGSGGSGGGSGIAVRAGGAGSGGGVAAGGDGGRSEENTSEIPSLMRISYAVFCLKNKKQMHDKNYNMRTLD